MANYGNVNGIRTRGNGRRKAENWAAEGFEQIDWNKRSYSWPEAPHCPVFLVGPGMSNGQAGIIARWNEVEIYFPYGTHPSVVKGALDDAILESYRVEAELANDPLDGPEWSDIVIPF